MKSNLLILLLSLLPAFGFAQQQREISPFDGRYWDVVLEHPDMKKVRVRENIQFGALGRALHLDVYLPLSIGEKENRATIVILNGIGDQNPPSMKTSAAHTSWARLLAAHGYVVVTMESEVNKIQESFSALFRYLSENNATLHIDPDKIGVQAFSANCSESVRYVMSPQVSKGIKGGVFYYGESPAPPFREDLPVYFVVAENDIRDNNYASLWQNVLKTNAPWTISIARDMPHAFDFFSDSETARRVIMSTISFWKDQLGPVPARTAPFSKEREIVAATYDRDQTRKLRLMREWMKEHPDSDDAYAFSAYASALMDTQDFAEAEKFLKKAITLEPDNKGNYLMMAVVSYALEKTDEGNRNLSLYERGDQPEAFTYFFIANRLLAIKKFKESIPLYERALSFPNPRPFMFYNLGVCHAMTGNADKAFENLQMAVEKGFGTKEKYEADENFQRLREDKRWGELMKKFQ